MDHLKLYYYYAYCIVWWSVLRPTHTADDDLYRECIGRRHTYVTASATRCLGYYYCDGERSFGGLCLNGNAFDEARGACVDPATFVCETQLSINATIDASVNIETKLDYHDDEDEDGENGEDDEDDDDSVADVSVVATPSAGSTARVSKKAANKRKTPNTNAITTTTTTVTSVAATSAAAITTTTGALINASSNAADKHQLVPLPTKPTTPRTPPTPPTATTTMGTTTTTATALAILTSATPLLLSKAQPTTDGGNTTSIAPAVAPQHNATTDAATTTTTTAAQTPTVPQTPETLCAALFLHHDASTPRHGGPKDPHAAASAIADELHYLPHGEPCAAAYYACYKGVALSLCCDAGTYFNALSSRCESMASVNCSVPTTAAAADYQCTLGVYDFLPNAEHCDDYQYCFNGLSLMYHCPFGHAWHYMQRACVPQADSHCFAAPQQRHGADVSSDDDN